jgi:DNA (cytosine-5)-methyltransferase 1
MRIGSLFSGIGGLELGLERAGLGPVVWQVEIDPFCRQVLAKHWPEVKRYEDVRSIIPSDLAPVDLICGGFPCQPFSTASRGRRVAADLWPDMLRVVRVCRPRFVVAENVSLDALELAAASLADEGYSCGVVSMPAAMVGAPHERQRWCLVADTDSDGESLFAEHGEMAGLPAVADVGPWANQPDRVGVDDGIPNRMDRLHALGNAVVPQCAEVIGWIVRELAGATP